MDLLIDISAKVRRGQRVLSTYQPAPSPDYLRNYLAESKLWKTKPMFIGRKQSISNEK